MAFATILHATTNHLVDAMLALMLMIGGVTGAQFGARAGQKMSAERLRLLLGMLVGHDRIKRLFGVPLAEESEADRTRRIVDCFLRAFEK